MAGVYDTSCNITQRSLAHIESEKERLKVPPIPPSPIASSPRQMVKTVVSHLVQCFRTYKTYDTVSENEHLRMPVSLPPLPFLFLPMYVQLMSQIMTLMSQIMTLNVLKGGKKVGRFRFFYWDVFTRQYKSDLHSPPFRNSVS